MTFTQPSLQVILSGAWVLTTTGPGQFLQKEMVAVAIFFMSNDICTAV